MAEKFKMGDRVASVISGYYCNYPGTIVGNSPYLHSNYRGKRSQYIIELDNGTRIHLPSIYIKRLEEDPG